MSKYCYVDIDIPKPLGKAKDCKCKCTDKVYCEICHHAQVKKGNTNGKI